MAFGDFAEKLGRLGIDRDGLPEKIPEKLMFEKEDIPEDLSAALSRALLGLTEQRMDMPFLHITPAVTLDERGVRKSTNFEQSIRGRGFDRNTSGIVFVDRDPDKNWKEATPEHFISRPELLLEALREAIQSFLHHGIRTNKRILGFNGKRGSREADYLAHGQGVPLVMVGDQTGIGRRRGVDGIEHYITNERISSDRIMGSLEVAGLDMESKQDVVALAKKLAELINDYLEKKSK